MGIVLSIFTIAAGADLAWSGGAVAGGGTRPDPAGLALVGVGLIWLLLSVLISNAYGDREPEGPRVVHLRGARPGAREQQR